MARKALRSVLHNIDIEPGETQVDTLITMLDHFFEHPNDYRSLIYD